MQKNIKFKNINLDLDSVNLQFTSQQSKLTFSFLGDQIVFDDVDDESSNIRFKQTSYDDVFIKLEDGIFKFEDIAGDLKYSLGISNNNGIFYSKYDLTIQPDANSGNGLISLNGSLNFENETNYLQYNDNNFISFFDSVEQDSHQITLEQGGTLQIGSGYSQLQVYNNEITGNEDDENTIISQGNEIKFYTNMQQGWQSKETQYIDQTGKYHGLTTSQEKLENQRLIELTGQVTGSQLFDGSQNITINQSLSQHNHNDLYYTETELQTSGSQQVHWDNITNKPQITLNTDTDISSNLWVLNENDFQSNSQTKVPTQYSTKMYVDNKIKIVDSITILSSGWTDDTGGSIGYWYYDISDSSIASQSYIEIDFDSQSQDYLDVLLSYNESFNGYVRLYQESQPQGDITISIMKIFN